MAEYIEREAAIEKTEAFCDVFVTKWTDEKVLAWIKNLPTADVAPAVHGEWIEDSYYGNPFVCSYCGCEGCYSGNYDNKQYYPTNYCPNCGAKMDGERKVPETNVGKMANWKLTDVDESGYEYECPHCFFHIGARVKGRGLPEECPNCGADMRERRTDG